MIKTKLFTKQNQKKSKCLVWESVIGIKQKNYLFHKDMQRGRDGVQIVLYI